MVSQIWESIGTKNKEIKNIGWCENDKKLMEQMNKL